MEKSNKGTVLPLDAGWSDIGSWESFWENSNKDINGNYIKGRVINHSSKDSFLEIGPGAGSLTEMFVSKSKNLNKESW